MTKYINQMVLRDINFNNPILCLVTNLIWIWIGNNASFIRGNFWINTFDFKLLQGRTDKT